MRASLRPRGWICRWLAALLVAQSLLSVAHACILASAPAPQPAVVMHAPDCEGHGAAVQDGNATLLCKAHCQAGQQSVNSSPAVADVGQAPLIGAPLLRVLDVASAEVLAADMPEALPVGPPAGVTPLYLSLLVLRN